jgi:hypothetical protein
VERVGSKNSARRLGSGGLRLTGRWSHRCGSARSRGREGKGVVRRWWWGEEGMGLEGGGGGGVGA